MKRSAKYSLNCDLVEFMEINVGDILVLKKEHPCGEKRWEVLRTGADIRIKCVGCSHQVFAPRKKIEKSVKEIIKKEANE